MPACPSPVVIHLLCGFAYSCMLAHLSEFEAVAMTNVIDLILTLLL